MAFIRVLSAYLFAILVFATVALGPWTILAASETMDIGCPFMVGETSFCSMSLFEHIEHWQSTFTFTLVQVLSFVAIVVSILLVLPIVVRPRLYQRQPESVHLPTLLQQLFSKGLLNSKAY